MTEKEKRAIETMQHWIEYEKVNKEKINKADELIEIQETVLQLIEKQNTEIEIYKTNNEILEGELKRIVDTLKLDEHSLTDNIIEEIKKKDTEIEQWKNYCTVDLEGQISDVRNENFEYKAELEKKEKIIDEMAEYINLLSEELIAETGTNDLSFCETEECVKNPEINCKDCIKEYFTKKVEGK